MSPWARQEPAIRIPDQSEVRMMNEVEVVEVVKLVVARERRCEYDVMLNVFSTSWRDALLYVVHRGCARLY